MGIIENIGASKRSVSGVCAMGMIMKLSDSESSLAMAGMVMITVVSIGYMIMDEIKRKKG